MKKQKARGQVRRFLRRSIACLLAIVGMGMAAVTAGLPQPLGWLGGLGGIQTAMAAQAPAGDGPVPFWQRLLLGDSALLAQWAAESAGQAQGEKPEETAPEEAEARKIIAAAQPALERGIGCIRSGRDFPAVKAGLTDKLKSGIVNAAFYRFIVRAKPFTVSDACIRCGKCENACPLGNLRLRDGTPVWGGRCTHCMACICRCPEEAIEYGKHSVGLPRYVFPEKM